MSFPLSNHCFVSSVTLAAIRQLGMESLEWDPEILMEGFETAFGMKKMSQKLFDKLNCGYMMLGTDAFTQTIEGFLSATAVMNDRAFEEDTVPYCSLEECAWSVWEYCNLVGDIKDGQPTIEFHPDIIKYIQEVGKVNGVSRFPIWLSFANDDPTPYPDMSGDDSQFEMYNLRQDEYIAQLNSFVTSKQDELTAELQKLEKLRLVG